MNLYNRILRKALHVDICDCTVYYAYHLALIQNCPLQFNAVMGFYDKMR
jgi:hypothetical protein